MRKTPFVVLLILFLIPASLFAVTTEVRIHPLIGYVYGAVSFSVEFFDEVLPFNLASDVVAQNSSVFSVGGLRVGKYTLQASNMNFTLYIAHEKLLLKERIFGIEDDGTLSSIDYRLYLETGTSGSFLSCLGDDNPDLEAFSNLSTAFQNKMVISGSSVDYQDQGIWISLEDLTSGSTAETVRNLKAGSYASNIYFYLETGD